MSAGNEMRLISRRKDRGRGPKNKVGAFLGSKLHGGRVTSSSAGNARTATDRQTAALEPGSNGGRSDEVYAVYSYCTRHKRKVARECQFSGKRVWAIAWGYVCAAQLFGGVCRDTWLTAE